MSAGVYPDGFPHPPPQVRQKIAIELGVIALLTACFLLFAPESFKWLGPHVFLALSFLGYIGLSARETREKIWGPPSSPEFDRVRRCAFFVAVVTLPPVIVFFFWGLIAGGVGRVFNTSFLLAMLCYLPWALLQQTLFQFYLLGRLRALLPWASPVTLSILNGVAYGIVHYPDIPVMLLTIIGGFFWSYSYHRDRYVLPIAISHAVLGSTFYYWVCGRDLVSELALQFRAMH